MLLDAIEEGLLFQQIARWITGQGKVGERNHLGTRGGGPVGEGEDLLSIAAQVADSRIRLCEGNLHGEATIVPGDGGRVVYAGRAGLWVRCCRCRNRLTFARLPQSF